MFKHITLNPIKMDYRSCAEYEPSSLLDTVVNELVQDIKELETGDRVRLFVVSCVADGAVKLEETLSQTYAILSIEPMLHGLPSGEAMYAYELVRSLPKEQIEKLYLGLEKVFEGEVIQPEPQGVDFEVEDVPDLEKYEPGQDTPKRREPTPDEIMKREIKMRRLRKDFPPPEPGE